jgi:hypothetical protein
MPDINEMRVQLQQLVQQGVFTPEEARTIEQESSSMNGITLDPKLKQNQMAALDQLSNIANEGGMTAMDRSKMAQIQNQENTAARGSREAILQNAQMRGMGGSGLELMSQMQNQQDAATRTSNRDMDVASMAQQRALDALIQSGQMSGQMQAQDFNQQAQVAGANDAISRFNAQNQQNQLNQNVGMRNQAQQNNLGAKQEIANANTQTQNQNQMYNKQLLQQQYENELKKRSGQAGIAQSNAEARNANSQAQANANNQFMGAMIGAGSAAYGAKGK